MHRALLCPLRQFICYPRNGGSDRIAGTAPQAGWVAHVSDRACGWADVLDESDDGQDEYRMHNQDPGEDRPTSKTTTIVAPNWDEATIRPPCPNSAMYYEMDWKYDC